MNDPRAGMPRSHIRLRRLGHFFKSQVLEPAMTWGKDFGVMDELVQLIHAELSLLLVLVELGLLSGLLCLAAIRWDPPDPMLHALCVKLTLEIWTFLALIGVLGLPEGYRNTTRLITFALALVSGVVSTSMTEAEPDAISSSKSVLRLLFCLRWVSISTKK